ncbi:MAG TPA: transposase [Candidatus Acidoferrales bacterium]|nr:transposase [Candidatus Acidoferrales bacterium]
MRPVNEQDALARGIIAPTTRMQRKNIRLARIQYEGQRKYFITLCSSKRSRFFARRELAERAIELLLQTAEKHEFTVHAYCFMPDHMHTLVESRGAGGDLLPFVMDYKRKTTVSLAQATGVFLWQKKFYDHILRRNDSPQGAAAYILMNPVRGKLCEAAGDYPFSGSMSADWKNGVNAADTWIPPWKEHV